MEKNKQIALKLNKVFEMFIEYKKSFLKKSTISCYEAIIDSHLSPMFGNNSFISELEVQNFIIEVSNLGIYRKNTIRDFIILLKTILKWANKKKIFISDFSTWDLEFPPDKNEPQKIEVYNNDEINKLCEFLFHNLTFKNLGLLTVTQTGMRIGEICGLKWGDIDLFRYNLKVQRNVNRISIKDKNGVNKSQIIIDTPKTKCSIREIPLANDLKIIYSKLLPNVNPEHFVLSNSEKPIDPRLYREYYVKLTKMIGLQHLKFHGLRHSFATRLIAQKADLKTVSTILGHSDVSITMNTYVHPDESLKQKTVENAFIDFNKSASVPTM